jgi:lysophospholipase L1-like esterase
MKTYLGKAVNNVPFNEMGNAEIAKQDIGLDNVDNTKDIDKPLSTPQKNYVDTSIQAQIVDSTLVADATIPIPVEITGNAHTLGTGPGTYPYWGDMVIPDGNTGTLQKVGGEFSVSLMASDLTLAKTSSQDISFTGSIAISKSAHSATISNGYILSRSVRFHILPDPQTVVYDVSTPNDFYICYLNSSDVIIIESFTIYTENYANIIFARFHYEDTEVIIDFACTNEISIDGLEYSVNNIIKNLLGNSVPTSDIKWCEIGDSITAPDNKDGSGGYLGHGYGQWICTKLGISYENHFPHGLSGNTFDNLYNNLKLSIELDCDLYTLFAGTNDWGTQTTNLGTPSDYINNTNDTAVTTYGAMRKMVDLIVGSRGGYPDKGWRTTRLILITPMYRGIYVNKLAGTLDIIHQAPPCVTLVDGEYIDFVNSRGFTLRDVVNAIKWVGQYEGLTVIDLYEENGFVPKRYLNFDPIYVPAQDILGDNLHPTELGYKLLGERLKLDITKKIIK